MLAANLLHPDFEDRGGTGVPIGSGEHRYEWVENWAKIPDTESARTGWAHHGIAVTQAGHVIAYHQGDPTVLMFDGDGNLLRSWDSGLTEGHGMTIVIEGATEYVWIADNGAKPRIHDGYRRAGSPAPNEVSGQVVKMTLDGQTVMRLERPPLPVYQNGGYSPTSVAVNEERHGGNGDVWVSDGYGKFYVHRYDKRGNYIASINGAEGQAGEFNLPHAICIDTRKSEPELYVGDERNRQIQVYDLEGKFKRAFGADYMTKPSGLGITDGLLMVMELGAKDLRARLWLLDEQDTMVSLLGDNPKVDDSEDWPNRRNEKGDLVRSSLVEPGRFHSPHMITSDSAGSIYVAEYLIGGRIIKLRRQ